MIDIHSSLYAALIDYIDRHNGEMPAKITMSREAIIAAGVKEVNFRKFPETYAGIPVCHTNEDGIHIYLSEPEIQLFPKPNANTIRIPREYRND